MADIKKQISLKIIYSAPEKIISELDEAIINVLENVGYIWYAEGYNFITGQRDLCFDRLK